MTKRRLLKPHPLIVPLIRAILLRFLKRRYRLDATAEDGVCHLKPPFIVVANHVNFWDPFWVSAFIETPIQFVASDNLFRTPFLGLAMRLLGSIPKTKLMNDTQTIGHIFRVLGAGGVVGIFPEGTRSYDGRSEPVQLSVARLIRKMKLPVVSALISGGYLARPRWARGVRHGAVSLHYRLLFAGQDCAALSVDEVYRSLSRELSFDEMTVQRERRIPFRTRRPAEYLERLLFICPQCRSVRTLVSRVGRLRCTACGYAVRVTETGFLTGDTGPLFFDDPADWNAWQLSAFRDLLGVTASSKAPLFQESGAIIMRGSRFRRLRSLTQGSLSMFADRLELRGRDGLLTFHVALIQGANVQNGEKLELYHGGALYRVDFSNPRSSPYMWVKAIDLLQRNISSVRREAASL
jgi:1-acyl-sn-glycerol-3-phosphate acyltransferase